MPLGVPRAHPEFGDFERRIEALGLSIGRPFHYLERTDSTNDRAKEAAREGAAHGALFLAETQDKGRGRQGRAWISPPHENLLFSLLLRFGRPVRSIQTLPLVVGLAVTECVSKAIPGEGARMKWPNDVLVGTAKVAGILVESVGPATNPAIIVGIGVNVHTRDFPPSLGATSVALHASRPPDRGELLLELLGALDRDLFLAAGRGLGPFAARLQARDYLRGSRVRSDAGSAGIAEGIDGDGRLVVRTAGGSLERWAAGEVHLVR